MKRSRESEQDYLTPPVFNGPTDGIIRSTRDLRPAHFLLKIESFSLLRETGTEAYESGIFEAGGHKWNLCFYPKGNSKNEGNGHISLYLKVADTASLPRGWEVDAKLTFFVFDQHRDKYLSVQDGTIRRFHETKTEWGLPQLLSLDIFNDVSMGYLVDDCCIFGAEVFVVKHTGRMEYLSMVKKPFKSIYTWKMENFSALNKEFYSSEGFTVQGIVWKLGVFPNGYSIWKKEGLFAFLHYDGTGKGTLPSNQKVYAEFKLRVKNQFDIKYNTEHAGRKWFCASSSFGGLCCLISLKDLEDTSKGYVLNDRLIVEAEIVVTSATKSLS